MSEGSRGPERPNLPPIEAHPEKPLEKGPLLDQLHQVADQGKFSRRTAIYTGVGLGASLLGVKKGIIDLGNASSSNNEGDTSHEIELGPVVKFAGRNEDGTYFFSNVAEYIELNEFEYRQRYTKQGALDGLEAPIIHEYNPNKEFEDAPSRSIDTDTKLAEDVKLVRLAIKADNGASNRIIVDPDDPNKNIDVWLGFAKENPSDPSHPIWTDENGNVLDDKINVVSPIFTDTYDPKND
ncbi:MAG: hypothetical protein KBC15_03445 [Candidatus Levybacteria bacterium]|nr:hypothetical protein [Candidatus Levybacteria bacterium]